MLLPLPKSPFASCPSIPQTIREVKHRERHSIFRVALAHSQIGRVSLSRTRGPRQRERERERRTNKRGKKRRNEPSESASRLEFVIRGAEVGQEESARQAPKKANHLSLKVGSSRVACAAAWREGHERRRRIAYEITGGPGCANVCEMTSKNLSRFADYSRTVVERTRRQRGGYPSLRFGENSYDRGTWHDSLIH